MPINDPAVGLAEKLGLTAAELRKRKLLLGLHAEEEAELAQLRPTVELAIDDIIEEFYRRQLAEPAIRALIGDRDTLLRLKTAMRAYVLDLFCGDYDVAYAERRLRVGRVHGRIGIPVKYYISSVFQLLQVLGLYLKRRTGSDYPPPALRRLLLLDMELTFDTYVHGLHGQIAALQEELVASSRHLEEVVRERTAWLEATSRIDALTGLYNRRAFSEALDRECAAAARRDGALCLMFADLNRFKVLNDTEGHAAGDRILKQVAQMLQRLSRTSDMVFRYGGDEFCLLLPDTSEAGAAAFRDRVLAEVPRCTGGRVGLSVGWAISAPGAPVPPDELLRLADVAMYAAKEDAARREAGRERDMEPGPRAGGVRSRRA